MGNYDDESRQDAICHTEAGRMDKQTEYSSKRRGSETRLGGEINDDERQLGQ